MVRRSLNSYQKMQELSALTHTQLLSIAVPEIQFYRDSRGLQALCPFHNDKSVGSFSFNPRNGVWKCFACGEGGQGAISLLMRVRGWDFLQAVDYLYEHRNDVALEPTAPVPSSLKQSHKVKPAPKSIHVKPEDTDLKKEMSANYGHVSLEDRHLIYKAFAETCPLTPDERLKLQRKRGLSYGDTSAFFRMPSANDDWFWIEFLERLREHDQYEGQERLYHSLLGTPGFFWDDELKCVSFVYQKNALGILLHSPSGLVNGIDMRVLEQKVQEEPKTKAARYIGFSSGSICERYPEKYSLGTKIDTFVDVVPSYYSNDSKKFKGYAITEGKFKAIHLSKRGYTALSVRGVGNWEHIIPTLKEMAIVGPVTIAFDADASINTAVAKASSNLGRALMQENYKVQYMVWELNDGKGFDDLCNAGLYYKAEVVPAEQYLAKLLEQPS